MFVRKNFLLIVILLAIVFAVAMNATTFQRGPTPPPAPVPAASVRFLAYWTNSQSEVNTYSRQSTGAAATRLEPVQLIFDTEDFRIDTQVKAASAASRANAIPVLKTSFVEKLMVDSLDCSLFTVVYTPVNTVVFPATLKVSHSMQSRDGIAYTQVNFRANGYQVSGHSYVEQEADETYRLDKVLLEDELYNRIRLNPKQLPTGSIHLIAGVTTTRVRHKKLEPQPAIGTIMPVDGRAWFGATGKPAFAVDSLQAYTLEYTEEARKLTLVFNKAFPHQILGWEETLTVAGRPQTTRAILVASTRSGYPKHQTPADSVLLHKSLH